MNTSSERYVQASKVAQYLGVTAKTVKAWAREFGWKTIEVKRGSRFTILIWKPDVDAFIKSRQVKEVVVAAKPSGRPRKFQIANNI